MTTVLTSEKEVGDAYGDSSPLDRELSCAEQQSQAQPANPYLDVRRGWNGVWEESLANARRWRLMALFEAGLLGLALFGLIHLGSQPKAIPYVVEVNKLGRGSLLRPVGAGSSR
jgi:type IV secretory pathway TrbF-like protein